MYTLYTLYTYNPRDILYTLYTYTHIPGGVVTRQLLAPRSVIVTLWAMLGLGLGLALGLGLGLGLALRLGLELGWGGV